jgi:hypothetical protein
MVRQNAAEVTVQLFPQRFIAKKRTPVFGGENGVNQDFGEGLGHDAIILNCDWLFNSLRVGELVMDGDPA